MSGLVLVTGGAGALGRHVLPVLAERGWKTRCLVHRRPADDAHEMVSGDLLDHRAVARAVEGVDAVLHLAAVTHARRAATYRRTNAEGTRLLADAARRQGVRRFVYASTRAIGEDGGAYSASKREAEAAVRGAGIPYVIVRLPEVYGTHGREGVDRLIALARRGRPIPLVGRGDDLVCPVFVDDALAVLVAALEEPSAIGKTYTLAGECLRVREVADACVAAFASRSRVVRVPTKLVSALATTARLLPLPLYPDQLARLRSEKPAASPEAASDLGFAPRPLREGLLALGGES